MYAMNRWYVAAFAWELQDKPVARTLLNRPVVLFRTRNGQVAALEDRCCHRSLPLSCGTVEQAGIRCGYHGLLYEPGGQCIEIPGQKVIPAKARVVSYRVVERNQIIWIWMSEEVGSALGSKAGAEPDSESDSEPPEISAHDDPRYKYGGGVFHYDAPYQLIHDNLLDLSHLGYVHARTIGGNPKLHMAAPTKVESAGEQVRVVRWLKDSEPPATYAAAWPFKGRIDRWQEIDFQVSYLAIWTGAVDVDSESLDDPGRGGFHMRGFHGITPETETTTHYFWTLASNAHPDRPDVSEMVCRQTEMTFEEDRLIIEAQHRNICRFGSQHGLDIHVDAGPNRARRIIERLTSREPG